MEAVPKLKSALPVAGGSSILTSAFLYLKHGAQDVIEEERGRAKRSQGLQKVMLYFPVVLSEP